ncbi:hypothetical protein H2198_001388 [Neophaeococcomyces mojaviensis]|uniref:Uncharacterized protein n=1 Tax=Neophaeococcomyces mojaviensis TaxID=3383035 RepID=A0ACC3AH84_9EURO|nr:hypothetical protein H2198_001388 [Knufia sp. JES_112]
MADSNSIVNLICGIVGNILALVQIGITMAYAYQRRRYQDDIPSLKHELYVHIIADFRQPST